MSRAAAPIASSPQGLRDSPSLPTAEVFIGGSSRPSEKWDPVVNPARFDDVVGEVADGTADDVDEAVRIATIAGAAWSQRPSDERRVLLEAAADAVEANLDELALLLTREQGKTLVESRSDVLGASGSLRYYAQLASGIETDELFRDDGRATIFLGKRPIGVTGVIVPWNSPVHLAFLGISPSLAAGNAVVVKPSSFAPLALSAVARLVADVLPAGVINVVPGSNDVGAAVTAHPGIRKIFFTGSTATGKRITAAAAGNLKRLSLELGGNDPAIVLESARIDDRTITELVRGTFSLSGQVCFGIKRIYAQRAVYDDVVAGFIDAAGAIVVGDGSRDGVSMGPVNNRPQWERVTSLVETARRSDARVIETGVIDDPSGWNGGYFVRPTVVTGLASDHPLVLEEQFGPVIPILPFDDEEDVLREANGTEFGLAASVWSADIAHARALAAQIESGSVFINAHRAGVSDVATPFGGMKQSGLGRNHGRWALDACLETQVIADFDDTSHFPPPAIG